MATFCLLHGDWHDGACWDPLIGPLRARGHEAVAPDLPYDDPDAGFEGRVRPALAALEGVPGPAGVVGHSASSGYAAFVAEATPGSLLVHLCPRLGPFPPPAGAPAAFRAGFPFPARNARRHRLGHRGGDRRDVSAPSTGDRPSAGRAPSPRRAAG